MKHFISFERLEQIIDKQIHQNEEILELHEGEMSHEDKLTFLARIEELTQLKLSIIKEM